MGFGFNLALIFFILPSTGIFLLLWLFTQKRIFGKILVGIWGMIFLLGFVSYASQTIFAKKVLEKKDYYGEYTIDRDYFPGVNADWQYNHYRFEIKENDSIYFHETDGTRILKTYNGKMSTLPQYTSARIVMDMEKPSHHILTTNPTTYRETWDFFLVFKSPKFNNMYFRKREWEKIE